MPAQLRLADAGTALVTLATTLALGACQASSSTFPQTRPSSLSTPSPSVTATPIATTPTATTDTPTPSAAACALVTEDDASAAIWSAAGPGTVTPSRSPDASQCVFRDGTLTITVNQLGRSQYETSHHAITAAPAGTWSDLSGVGQAAFGVPRRSIVSFTFYNNASYDSIILAGSTAADPTGAAITLAKTAATHT